jgi:hypothetical protein
VRKSNINGTSVLSNAKQNNFISEERKHEFIPSVGGGSSSSFLPETNNLSNQSSSHASYRQQQPQHQQSALSQINYGQERESGSHPVKKSSVVPLPLALRRVLKGEENNDSSGDEQQQPLKHAGGGIATCGGKTKEGSHSATSSPIADRLKKKKNNLYKKLDPIPIPPFQPIPSFY